MCANCGSEILDLYDEPGFSLSGLLPSTVVPEPADLADAREQALRCDKHLVDVEDAICRFQARLNQLQSLQKRLKQQLNKYRSISSPIRRLPVELIRHVFLMYALDEPRETKWHVWVLGQICSRWRSIALAYPDIWASVPYAVQRWSRPAIIEEHLRRSAPRPLQVTVGNVGEGFPEQTALLVGSSSRWEQLTLYPSFSALNTIQRAQECGFPMLRSLEIVCHYGGCKVQQISALLTSPSLRRLSFSCPTILDDCTIEPSHLEEVRLNLVMSDLARMLPPICANLVVCHLSIDKDGRTAAVIHEMHFPRLRVLHLQDLYAPRAASKLLEQFETPALEELQVFSSHQETFQSCADMIARSNPPLFALRLISPDRYPSFGRIVCTMLDTAPQLLDLTLVGRPEILSCVSPALADGSNTPRLVSFSLHLYKLERARDGHYCLSSLAELLEHRINSGHSIQNVHITGIEQAECIDRLLALKCQNLDIRVTAQESKLTTWEHRGEFWG
ncbi:hypothetical protein HGRIS_013739 [Hohenbuehelia grisea]|uniref:F-box domain-containing protein n=1 Tax=Hohenbuehelia grisea TaxID=104357 RepID=A0ABR3IWE7_9AGAR